MCERFGCKFGMCQRLGDNVESAGGWGDNVECARGWGDNVECARGWGDNVESPYFLSSSFVSFFYYFVHDVPMRKCFGQTWDTFFMVILIRTYGSICNCPAE